MGDSISPRGEQHLEQALDERRGLVIVNGIPGSGKSTIAKALSNELRYSLVSKDSLKDFLAEAAAAEPDPVLLSRQANDVLWAILGAMKRKTIIETWFGPTGATVVRLGLETARVLEENVVEVWCEAPRELARDRFMARLRSDDRHPRHNLSAIDPTWWVQVDARPLGVGTLIEVSTAENATDDSVRQLAETIRTLLSQDR